MPHRIEVATRPGERDPAGDAATKPMEVPARARGCVTPGTAARGWSSSSSEGGAKNASRVPSNSTRKSFGTVSRLLSRKPATSYVTSPA